MSWKTGFRNKGELTVLTEARRREVLELAQQLVRIPSLSGREKQVARAVREGMQKLG